VKATKPGIERGLTGVGHTLLIENRKTSIIVKLFNIELVFNIYKIMLMANTKSYIIGLCNLT